MLKGSIAVILAPNVDNVGMYSVDMAARELFTSSGCNFKLLQYGAKRISARYGRVEVVDYHSRTQIEGFDTVVLWGDFTTLPYYGRIEFPSLVRRYEYGLLARFLAKRGVAVQRQLEFAFSRWHDLFVDGPTSRDASHSIGQNFQIIPKPTDATSGEIGEVRSALSRFSSIIVRDSLSRANLSTFDFRHGPKLYQGMDVAFLLGQVKKKARIGRKPRIGMFFKRSGLNNIERLNSELDRAGFEVAPVPGWLSTREDIDQQFQRAIAFFQSCDVVVSDTYHCLINAYREGAAIVGIGRPAERQTSSISDYKKKILFEDLGFPSLYFEARSGQLNDDLLKEIVVAIKGVIGGAAELQRRSLADRVEQFRSTVKGEVFGGTC